MKQRKTPNDSTEEATQKLVCVDPIIDLLTTHQDLAQLPTHVSTIILLQQLTSQSETSLCISGYKKHLII